LSALGAGLKVYATRPAGGALLILPELEIRAVEEMEVCDVANVDDPIGNKFLRVIILIWSSPINEI